MFNDFNLIMEARSGAMKKYTYDGKTYNFWELKKALPNAVFSPDTPDALFAQLGVAVIEEPDPEPIADPLASAKQRRREEVSAIEVAVDGMVFDGNETAQRRMAGAILGWASGVETIRWVLADDSVASVTRTQLEQALRLAVAAMQALWVAPYGE